MYPPIYVETGRLTVSVGTQAPSLFFFKVFVLTLHSSPPPPIENFLDLPLTFLVRDIWKTTHDREDSSGFSLLHAKIVSAKRILALLY